MKGQHIFKLVEGKFSPAEAGKIMYDLIQRKIHFHSVESLAIAEKYDGDVSHSERRIAELQSVRASLKKVLEYAAEYNKEILVKGDLEITLLD
jgi:hypothetical protein